MSVVVPNALALANIADGSAIVASDHRNNYSAVQVGVNGLIAMFTAAPTKGDLIVSAGGGSFDKLAVGANGQTPVADSTQPLGVKYALPPGYEYAYNQITGNVSVVATTEATATTVVTASAVTFDGATSVIIEFFATSAFTGAGASMNFYLYDGATSIGIIGVVALPSSQAVPVHLKVRLTPAAAAKTYGIRATVPSATGSVSAGAGGLGVAYPAFIRITKV